MIYNLVSMLGDSNREDMSKTFLTMSSSVESCQALRQSGCIPLLVQLIQASELDAEVRGRATSALRNIVYSQGDEKRRRREIRVFKLLEDIREYCEVLRNEARPESCRKESDHFADHPTAAIGTLMKFSFDAEHRQAICTLGGLQTILELVQVDHKIHGDCGNGNDCLILRRYASMSLTNLTFGDGKNKAILCRSRVFLSALVDQLKCDNEDLRQVVASLLRNLSWRADNESQDSLREVGAIGSLMVVAMETKKEATLKSALSALWNLSSHCPMNKADICAVPGALEFLVKILRYKSSSNIPTVVENAGGIIRNISSHIAVRDDYRQILRDNNCFEILLEQLKSSSLIIVSNSCGTLWNLSARCFEDQKKLWEMGAADMLRNLVNSKHKMISMGSVAALKNLLAANPDGVLTPRLDSIAKNYGFQNLPTLIARKQRALEQEITATLGETSGADECSIICSPERETGTSGCANCHGNFNCARSDSAESVLSAKSDSAQERLNRAIAKEKNSAVLRESEEKHDSSFKSLGEEPTKKEDRNLMRRYKSSMIPTLVVKEKKSWWAQDVKNVKEENNKIQGEIPMQKAKPKKKPSTVLRESSLADAAEKDCIQKEKFRMENDGTQGKELQIPDESRCRLKSTSLCTENSLLACEKVVSGENDLENTFTYDKASLKRSAPNGESLNSFEGRILFRKSYNRSPLTFEKNEVNNKRFEDGNKIVKHSKNRLAGNSYETSSTDTADNNSKLFPNESRPLELQATSPVEARERNSTELNLKSEDDPEKEVENEKQRGGREKSIGGNVVECPFEMSAVPRGDRLRDLCGIEPAGNEASVILSTNERENKERQEDGDGIREVIAPSDILPHFKIGSQIEMGFVLSEAKKISQAIRKFQDGDASSSQVSAMSHSSSLDFGDYSLFDFTDETEDSVPWQDVFAQCGDVKSLYECSEKPFSSLSCKDCLGGTMPSLEWPKNTERTEAFDLESSMVSIPSISSEIADTTVNSQGWLGSASWASRGNFEESASLDDDGSTLDVNYNFLKDNAESVDEDNSLMCQENLPWDNDDACNDAPVTETRQKVTPREKRKLIKDRYKTYIIRNNRKISHIESGIGESPQVSLEERKEEDINADYNVNSTRSPGNRFFLGDSMIESSGGNFGPGKFSENGNVVNRSSNFKGPLKMMKNEKNEMMMQDGSRSLRGAVQIEPSNRKELTDNAKLVALSLKIGIHESEAENILGPETEELSGKGEDIDTTTYIKGRRKPRLTQWATTVHHYDHKKEDLNERSTPLKDADNQSSEIREKEKKIYRSCPLSANARGETASFAAGTREKSFGLTAAKSLPNVSDRGFLKLENMEKEGTFTGTFTKKENNISTPLKKEASFNEANFPGNKKNTECGVQKGNQKITPKKIPVIKANAKEKKTNNGGAKDNGRQIPSDETKKNWRKSSAGFKGTSASNEKKLDAGNGNGARKILTDLSPDEDVESANRGKSNVPEKKDAISKIDTIEWKMTEEEEEEEAKERKTFRHNGGAWISVEKIGR